MQDPFAIRGHKKEAKCENEKRTSKKTKPELRMTYTIYTLIE